MLVETCPPHISYLVSWDGVTGAADSVLSVRIALSPSSLLLPASTGEPCRYDKLLSSVNTGQIKKFTVKIQTEWKRIKGKRFPFTGSLLPYLQSPSRFTRSSHSVYFSAPSFFHLMTHLGHLGIFPYCTCGWAPFSSLAVLHMSYSLLIRSLSDAHLDYLFLLLKKTVLQKASLNKCDLLVEVYPWGRLLVITSLEATVWMFYILINIIRLSIKKVSLFGWKSFIVSAKYMRMAASSCLSDRWKWHFTAVVFAFIYKNIWTSFHCAIVCFSASCSFLFFPFFSGFSFLIEKKGLRKQLYLFIISISSIFSVCHLFFNGLYGFSGWRCVYICM